MDKKENYYWRCELLFGTKMYGSNKENLGVIISYFFLPSSNLVSK